jgi:prepilin-type N-terminal cleavage/methylation domain-containing protein
MPKTNELKLSFGEGFTFIEMMIVVFLMSLIVSITTIFFAGTLPTAKLKATARDLTATIKYAKHLAYAKNEKQVINIDLDAKSYAIKGREVKNIAPEVVVTVYEADVNTNPIREGKYSIAYDATGGSSWDAITVSRGAKIITIKMDPILTAVIVDGKKNERDQK